MASSLTFPETSIYSGTIRIPSKNRANFKTIGKVRGDNRVRVRVCGRGGEDEVVRVLDYEKGRRCLAVVKQSSPWKQSEEDEEKQKYYVNIGYAIRTLREEFTQIFHREPSFHIYRDDIIFKDPMNTFIGIENYKSIFWALRFHGSLFFKSLRVDIASVWNPVENVIMIRWTVHGIPRVPWEGQGRFDGTSEYKLDKDGKIFEHKVDNVLLNSPPKFRVVALEEMIQFLGCPSTPKPTYFEISEHIC